LLTVILSRLRLHGKNCKAMIKLSKTLEQSGFDNIQALVEGYESELETFIEQNQNLFAHACTNKPQNTQRQTLLGLLTKSHIDASYGVESNKDTSHAMQKIFNETVGVENSQKFQNSHIKHLVFVTHLWLFVQGRMGMDFSLANDHAAATSKLILSIQPGDFEVQRTGFMASFYDGFSLYSANQPQSRWSKVLNIFKR